MANWVTQGNNINPNDWLGTTNNQPLIIRTNNTERVRVTPDGSLRVGSLLMTPQNPTTEGGEITLLGAGANPPATIDNLSGSLRLITQGGDRLRVTPDGNVGIGTTNPGSKLEVQGELRIHRLFFVDSNGIPYPDNWIGMANNIEGTTRWLHIGGITDGGVRRLTLWADRTLIQGNVEVTGDIRLLGPDCAENFDVSEAEAAEPGTVMVIDQEGTLKPSDQPYDKRVAGVVSGAGGLKPGIILDKQESNGGRLPVALIGKVACKVDARYSPIEVGDLLTTSPTAGYAMKADDSRRAFGAVLGKALRALNEGTDTIPVMVALQ